MARYSDIQMLSLFFIGMRKFWQYGVGGKGEQVNGNTAAVHKLGTRRKF